MQKYVKESAQSRLDRGAAKHGLGKPNKAADDYTAKLMKKYGAKDMADLKKKMGVKESLQELTQKDLENIMNRKKANLVRTGRAKPEPKKAPAASKGRGTDTEDDHSIVMQLRKAQDLKGKHDIKVGPGKNTRIPLQVIDSLLNTYDRLKSTSDKKKFATMATHELRKRAGMKSTMKKTDDAPPPRTYKPSRSYTDRDAAKKLGRGKIRAPGKKDKDDGPTGKDLRKMR